MEAYENLK